MQKLYSFFFLLLMAVAVISCKDKSEDVTPDTDTLTISISDPNAVTAALVLEGATLIDGIPHAANSNGALHAYPIKESITGITNFCISIPLSISKLAEDQIAGAYFAVKGSSKYFDIPWSAFVNEYTEEDSLRINRSIKLNLPKNLESGEFCAEICLYDYENSVSNVIEVCITVVAFGGEGSEFLTANEWEGVYFESFGRKDTFGVKEVDSGEYYCKSIEDYITVKAQIYMDYVMKFDENGTWEASMAVIVSSFNHFDNDCNPVFTSTEQISFTQGAWSYNAEEQCISYIRNVYSSLEKIDGVVTSEETINATSPSKTSVLQQNGLLMLRYPGGGEFTFWFKPKE